MKKRLIHIALLILCIIAGCVVINIDTQTKRDAPEINLHKTDSL